VLPVRSITGTSLGAAAFLAVAAHLFADFRWIIPAVFLLALLSCLDRFEWTRAHVWLAAFTVYVLLSCLWSPASPIGIGGALLALAVALMAFQVGAQSRTIAPVFVGASLALVGYFIAAWISPQFDNKNLVGEVAALVVIGAAAYRLWWFVPVPLATLLLLDNRGAYLGLVAAAVAALWGPRRYALGVALFAAFVVGTVFLFFTSRVITSLPTEPLDTGLQRAIIWGDALRNLSVFGHGAASYWSTINVLAPHAFWRPIHPHNDWLLLIYTYGVGSLLLLPLYPLLRDGPAALVLIGFGAIAMVQSPASNPATLLIGGVCLGYAAQRRDRRFSAMAKNSKGTATRGGSVNNDTTRTGTAPSPKTLGPRNA
jgi:O-Antigen ligase